MDKDNRRPSPPIYFDDVGAAVTSASVGNLVLIEYQVPPDLDPVRLEPVVAARLRFGLKAALALRHALDNIINDLAPLDDPQAAGPPAPPSDDATAAEQPAPPPPLPQTSL